MVAPRVSDASVQRSPQRAIPRGARGAAAAVLYVFLWATAFVPSRVLARGAPPLGILAIRFLIAGGILLAIAAALRMPIPRDGRTWLRLFVLGLGGNALYLGMTYVALRHLSAVMGSIIASTNPLILALLAPSLLAEPLTPRRLIRLGPGVSRPGAQRGRLHAVVLDPPARRGQPRQRLLLSHPGIRFAARGHPVE